MNDDPQLIIFEPLKNPRTVILKVKEDSVTDPATIFDENGCTVANYNVLYDESQSITTTPEQEKIIAYIENWESQSNTNVITEKQARKIEKRKRIQSANNRKKERNKKRKAAMKSLIHCSFDRNALANIKDVEEERAILQAMKMRNHSIKDVLNVKKNRNRFINLNTNYRPLENSTIELGRNRTPIDVVVLDSDEEPESDDDDILINIDPQPQIQCRNRVADFSKDGPFRNANSLVTSDSNARKCNKRVELVQIIDSSDSDVECVSNSLSVESLSDDDDNLGNTSVSEKMQLNNPANAEVWETVVDGEISQELNNLVDSFVNKYIQNVMPITPAMNTEPPTPQIVITESISLQPTPLPLSNKSKNIQPSPSSSFTKSKKNRNKRVAFNYSATEDAVMNDDELVIIEHDPLEDEYTEVDSIDESVQTDTQTLIDANMEENQSVSDDSNEFKVTEDEDDRSPSLVDFASVPSPDYTPMENISATASNLKAFAEFIRNRREQNDEDEEDEFSSKVRKSTSPITECTQKSTEQCQTPTHRTPSASKRDSYPWLKRTWDKSNEIIEVKEHPINQLLEPSKLWQNRRCDKSDKTRFIEHPAINRNQKKFFSEQSAVPEVHQFEKFSQVGFGKRGKNRNSFPDQKPRRNPSSFLDQGHCSNRRSAPMNTAVEFFNKNSIRIGESGYKPENVYNNEKQTEQHRSIESVNSTRKFYPKKFLQCERDDESNNQIQNNSQRTPFNREPFCQRENRQYGTIPNRKGDEGWRCQSASGTAVSTVLPKEKIPWRHQSKPKACVTSRVPLEKNETPWQHVSQPEVRVDIVPEKVCDNCRGSGEQQSQQYREPISDESHPYNVPVRCNRYHPEPHEKNKFGPRFGKQFQQCQNPWLNQNRNPAPYRADRNRCNQQYNNGPPMRCVENTNFNRGSHFQPRFVPSQGQRFHDYPSHQHSFRHHTQYKTKFNHQQTGGERQRSNYNQQPNYQYRSDPQTVTARNTQQPVIEEGLFTRRGDKFGYKANLSDFDDFDTNNQRQQQPYRPNSCNRDLNANFHQANDVENYESNVIQKLPSSTSNENTFTWENNQPCDFVPFNANQPISSSPPWSHDYSNSDNNPGINALSRRVWIENVINSKT